jgi:uncharacterized protein (TIGR02996 family)
VTARDYRTNPEYRALLASVLAAPADDAPRLVLADWFEDNGEGERAEWIRRCIWHPEIHPANGFRADWLAWPVELGNGACFDRAEFQHGGPLFNDSPCYSLCKRGFIEAVHLPAASWLSNADRILAEHPVTSVRLTTEPTFVPILNDGGPLFMRFRGYGETVGAAVKAIPWTTRVVDNHRQAREVVRELTEKLFQANWPGVAVELPPERPLDVYDQSRLEPVVRMSDEVGVPIAAEAIAAARQRLTNGRSGTLTIGGQVYPITHWEGPHPVTDGDPAAPLPLGEMTVEFGDMPPIALTGPTRLIDGEWTEPDPPNPMVRDEKAIAKRRAANKAARKARARNRR